MFVANKFVTNTFVLRRVKPLAPQPPWRGVAPHDAGRSMQIDAPIALLTRERETTPHARGGHRAPLIAETACHAGHLDAARELTDGRRWLVLT
ncbi:DinB family protein [Streptomyces sp. NBC_01335]|uniref:hypothetical protein n=1 Tax=Streptomyces sp. NBC_01335 TaxID=2903828 RepID=UPI002E12C35B|nr:DinB family protein [Streptomyces sp. NBC_01335]